MTLALHTALAYAGVFVLQQPPAAELQEALSTVAGFAAGLVIAVVLILSAATLALWGMRKAGASRDQERDEAYMDHMKDSPRR
ncbi:hypothetical protein [Rubrobacter indicoceani]|uniref:hypothetical protein n=1 Tax=Rubrobacter indicoceani TaxID=2051957 RepID=UPI000E5AAA50|nr:hypothetical protein [Rubrobacter indicoceani]